MRAFWTGTIQFGLVAIPARLYPSSRDDEPKFHMLHAECGARIEMVRRCPKCGRDLAYSDCVRGVEISPEQYATLTAGELKAIDGDADEDKTIAVLSTADPAEIGWELVDKTYWVGPRSHDLRSYALVRRGLSDKNLVAVCRVKLRARTRIAVLRPSRPAAMTLTMLRFASEVAEPSEISASLPKAPEREASLAHRLAEALTAPFVCTTDPGARGDAVLAAALDKVAAGEIVGDGVGTAGGADLAEQLEKSIPQEKKKSRRRSEKAAS